MRGLKGFVFAFAALFADHALAAERLSEAGAALPAMAFAPGGGLEARVDAAGDEVLSVNGGVKSGHGAVQN